MPIYTVRCNACDVEGDVFRKVDERDVDLPYCPQCHGRMERQITATSICPDIQPYQSQITGEMITSRSQHREHLREHRCIEIGNETGPLLDKLNKDREMVISKESAERRKRLVADLVDQKLWR